MQEIVSKVLEAEKAAEKCVQEAKAQAAEIRAQADRKVEQRMQEAREEAGRRLQEIVSRARSKSASEYEKAMTQAREENKVFLEHHDKDINIAVENVVALIVSSALDR